MLTSFTASRFACVLAQEARYGIPVGKRVIENRRLIVETAARHRGKVKRYGTSYMAEA